MIPYKTGPNLSKPEICPKLDDSGIPTPTMTNFGPSKWTPKWTHSGTRSRPHPRTLDPYLQSSPSSCPGRVRTPAQGPQIWLPGTPRDPLKMAHFGPLLGPLPGSPPQVPSPDPHISVLVALWPDGPYPRVARVRDRPSKYPILDPFQTPKYPILAHVSTFGLEESIHFGSHTSSYPFKDPIYPSTPR